MAAALYRSGPFTALAAPALAVLALACGHRQSAVAVGVVAVDIPPAPSIGAPEPMDDEPPAARGTRTPPDHRGTWEGHGLQNDGQTWPIRVQVLGAGEQPCATVAYAAHDDWDTACAGEWICDQEETTPTLLVGEEHILEGFERCIESCHFRANLAAGLIEFDCSQAGVMAEARIERVR